MFALSLLLITIESAGALLHGGDGWLVYSGSSRRVEELLHPALPGLRSRLRSINTASVKRDAPDSLLHSLRLTRGIDTTLNHQITPTSDVLQRPAPWGLERIFQRGVILGRQDQEDTMNFAYLYSTQARGQNVDVFLLDSGIACGHGDFAGRTTCPIRADMIRGRSSLDDNGHGTQVASAIGSTTLGTCKLCHLYSVKIMDARNVGYVETAIAGVELAMEHIRNSPRRALIVMPFISPYNEALQAAVTYAGAHRVLVVTASGDAHLVNRCEMSPTRPAMVVSGFDMSDIFDAELAGGKCVDILAPSVAIRVWSHLPPYNEALMVSGSSLATGFAAGAMASWLSHPVVANMPFDGLRLWPTLISERHVLRGMPADGRTANAIIRVPNGRFLTEFDQRTQFVQWIDRVPRLLGLMRRSRAIKPWMEEPLGEL
ncbi:hypothetical protein PYCC9005_002098 [Savitreella phatthalungensis]